MIQDPRSRLITANPSPIRDLVVLTSARGEAASPFLTRPELCHRRVVRGGQG
jgi:hypothetical protein